MARSYPPSETQQYGQPDASEWQELRGELVALLDQVEGQVARTGRQEPGYAGLAERMRDLRHQVTEIAPDTRHREALRSVQRAVDRFSDVRDEPPRLPGRDHLDAAIQQIRSRHFDAPRPMPQASDSRFGDLADAVGGISGRLERLEGELKSHARGQTANVKEIAEQVGQLSNVVELLAGAVGETGQVKRLEAQIGGLAKLVTESRQPDLGAVNRRLDDVSQTVAKLAELQKHYADRSDTRGMTQRLDDVTATVGRLADLQVQFAAKVDAPRDGLREAIGAVEAGVRNIYDRIDSIEKSVASPPAELEAIAAELARFAAAIKTPQQPHGLIELIDALNERISDIETRNFEVGALKDDIGALRDTVLGALEPRFAVLETRLEALSDNLERRPAETNIAQLEAQVRQLVARMDQTGEQLTGLAKLYSSPAEAQPLPDFSEIADLVAERTSAAVSRFEPAPQAGLDAAGLDEIEKRVSRIVKAAVKAQPVADTSGIEATVREVSERLGRLESSVARVTEAGAAPGPMPAPVHPAPIVSAASAIASRPVQPPEIAAVVRELDEPQRDALAPLIAAFDAEFPPAQPAAPVISALAEPADAMPANPGDDNPLVDKPFGDSGPVRAALEAKNGPRQRHPGLGQSVEAIADTPSAVPPLQPLAPRRPGETAEVSELPPPPVPSPGFGAEPREMRAAVPERQAPVRPAEPVPVVDEAQAATPNRNTFIAAHRRAARLAADKSTQTATSVVPPATPESGGGDGNSLIARALARFQIGRAAGEKASDAAAPQPKAPALKGKPVKAKRAEKPAKETGPRKLAGDKEPASRWSADDTEPKAAVPPAPPAPDWVSVKAEATSPAIDEETPAGESFLSRHRQPILLAASVVALAFLTLNLISQRIGEDGASASVDTGQATLDPTPMAQQETSLAANPGPPRVIPMVDSLATASIDPSAAKNFTPATAQDMPPAFEAAAPDIVAAPIEVAALPLAAGVAPLTTEPLSSPVHVELPPDAIGPRALLQAAADGDARAQFEVAAIYTEGRAVPADLAQAAVWYERAAVQGFAPAQYRLGNLYETGKGVVTDLAQARLWYQQAAESGNRMAMHNLAALYAGGGLGTQQFDAAAKWFEEAAGRGMKDSQFNLGMLYARGLGVEQSLDQSWKWFALAAQKGDADAAKARDDIAASLDAASIARLQDELAAWKPASIDLPANFAPIGTWSQSFDPGAPITEAKVVAGVQRALTQLGFDVGTPDGMAGPKTADAVRAFERATGMSESGTINPRLLAVLGSQPV